jgi:hypothetical protein
VNTVVMYLKTPGLEGYGYTLLVMLILNMLFQLVIVWLQTTKGPKATMVKDMMYVVSAVKPGVDAWRVATGQEQNEYQAVDAKMELILSKGCELVFEAIPGCVVQVQAYLIVMGTEEGANWQALVSIAISALSTGFTAATITFDMVSRPLLTQCTSPHPLPNTLLPPPVPAGHDRVWSPPRS